MTKHVLYAALWGLLPACGEDSKSGPGGPVGEGEGEGEVPVASEGEGEGEGSSEGEDPIAGEGEGSPTEGEEDICDENLDADCDAVADGADNCPRSDNPVQKDTDEDGLGDVCDPEPERASFSLVAAAIVGATGTVRAPAHMASVHLASGRSGSAVSTKYHLVFVKVVQPTSQERENR